VPGKSRGELAGETVRERPEDDGGSGKRQARGSGGGRKAPPTSRAHPRLGREQRRQRDANVEETWEKPATEGKEIGGSVNPNVGFAVFSRGFREVVATCS
jgi:hypothetical protein